MPEHEVDLLGLLISDGQCSTPDGSPLYTSGDPALNRGGIMERNRFSVWLQALGLAVKSPQKFVPAAVFELSAPLLARFLRALFSGDGGISISGEGIQLEFCSTSERLARDVHHLLLRFRVVAMLRHRETSSGRGAWVLSVTSKDEIARFAEKIGFLPGSHKQKRLEEALKRIELSPSQKSNFDTLPREAWTLLKQSCLERGTSLRGMGLESSTGQSVSRRVAGDLAERLSDERLGAVVDSDVLWDTVREKRFVGFEPVYDLTLPDTANFVANDMIVHNSTYARCGIIVNVTPFEPEWEGIVTLEVSNTTPLPAKIYANEGIAQVLFFESDEVCEVSYADKKGKYQAQKVLTLPKL